jgi:hypothetical protein
MDMERTMRVIIAALAGAVALGMAPGLGAQQKTTPKKQTAPKTSVPERDGCVTTDGRTECRFLRRASLDSALMKRPALGIQLSPTGTARDTLGVFVSRVTPKGPAENAGVIEGDRIVSINGVDLRVNAADAGDSYAAGLPSRRLSREVSKLTPGSVASLRVYSGGRVRDVQVTVGRASDLREAGAFGMLMDGGPGAEFHLMPDMDEMRMQLRELPRMKWEQMQLPKMRMEELEMLPLRLEGLRDRMWVERFAPYGEGARVRVLAPSRIKITADETKKEEEKKEQKKK